MRNFKNYYRTKQFAELANVSSKSLGRLKKELLETNPETVVIVQKHNKNYYHFSLLEKFVSADVYEIYRQRAMQTRIVNLDEDNQLEDESAP